jgi:hypothetical protein
MTKYRFKTEEEFKRDSQWDYIHNVPSGWNSSRKMNEYIGQDIDDDYNVRIECKLSFTNGRWTFSSKACILNSIELSEEETTEILKQIKNNSLITKRKMKSTATKSVKKNPVGDKFVFMDKTVSILNVGFSTRKNVILYGPGE